MTVSSTDYFNWAKQNGVGLLNRNQEFVPVRFALTPYEISHQDWRYLKESAQALMELMLIIGKKKDWLLAQLQPMLSTDTLIKELLVLLKEQSIKRMAQSLMLARYDFVLNSDKQWKLIESNTIAAGMGPMCEQVVLLQKEQQKDIELATNAAIQQQSATLFKAAHAIRDSSSPLILFLIEEQEDNVFDQRMLAQALQLRGAKVVFSTLKELSKVVQSQPENNGDLRFNELGVVDLIYFRTGYNLSDYQDDSGSPSANLSLRNHLEQFHLVVCPSIADQLVSSKWLQMVISAMSVEQIIAFGLDKTKAQLVYDVLDVSYQVATEEKQIEDELSSGKWLLKSHGEGGGNVLSSTTTNKLQDAIKQKYLLMERINIISNNSTTSFVENGEQLYIDATTTEVGIFIDSAAREFNGYLARTKPAEELECGVHRARGMINGIALKKD